MPLGIAVMAIKARYKARRRVVGGLVYVSLQRTAGRNMQLEDLRSRAVLRNEVHELILSADASTGPGSVARDVAYVGFFEIQTGGMVLVGDEVWAGETHVGTLAGFDLTHFPNHLNIVVATSTPATGAELGLEVGTTISFRSAPGAALVGDRS